LTSVKVGFAASISRKAFSRFSRFGHDGVGTDVQHACGVANATGIQGHLNDLLFDRRRLSWVAIVQEEGTAGAGVLAAAVSLLALPRLAMADNIRAVTVGTMQDLKDHEATQSSWGCGAAVTHPEDNTSTPLLHLHPEIDALFKQQAKERDRSKRQALLHEIQRVLYDKTAYLPRSIYRCL
jgi:ABC-type transport system substrate-binding protein